MGKTPEDGDALAMQDTPPPEDLQFYYECSRRETWPHAIVKYGLLGLFVPVKVLVMVTMMVMLYVLCKLCLIGTHAPVKVSGGRRMLVSGEASHAAPGDVTCNCSRVTPRCRAGAPTP